MGREVLDPLVAGSRLRGGEGRGGREGGREMTSVNFIIIILPKHITEILHTQRSEKREM